MKHGNRPRRSVKFPTAATSVLSVSKKKQNNKTVPQTGRALPNQPHTAPTRRDRNFTRSHGRRIDIFVPASPKLPISFSLSSCNPYPSSVLLLSLLYSVWSLPNRDIDPPTLTARAFTANICVGPSPPSFDLVLDPSRRRWRRPREEIDFRVRNQAGCPPG